MKLELPQTHKQLWLWITAAAFALMLDVGCIFHLSSKNDTIAGTLTVVFTAIGVLLLPAVWLMYKNADKPLKTSPIGFGAAAALWCFTAGEVSMGTFIVKEYVPYTLMGYALYAVPFLLGAVIFKRPKIWFCVLEVLFTVYAAAQSYVISFRQAPVKFTDLSNIGSAMEIQSEYSLVPTFAVWVMAAQLAVILFLTVKTGLVSEAGRPRLITLGGITAAALAVGLLARYTYDRGVNNRTIRLNFSGIEELDTSREVGDLLMFCYDGLFNRVAEPEGYSEDKAKEILSAYPMPDTGADKHPVIIAILCESFSDYSHISPLKTNKDYMPFVRSLKENTVKGYVTVSPYGGYTCNSEFEFMTGNSMFYLPLGSAPYTNYLKDPADGLVADLDREGFDTVAYIPSSPTLWNIRDIYKLYGFDRMYFQQETGADYSITYNDALADSELFRGIERIVEERDRSKGLFVWTKTMQNHAPYDVPVEGGIELQEPGNAEAERFLNCIYQSDKAIGELIDHFKDNDEQVVIAVFGDHFPHIEGFAETLYGGQLSGLNAERYSKLHQTPFIIWSNRPIEAKETEAISLNYLANEVLKAAGLPLSPARQELEHIRESLPAVSSFGYMTADGQWHQRDEKAKGYESILNEYHTVQYYRMFDEKVELPTD